MIFRQLADDSFNLFRCQLQRFLDGFPFDQTGSNRAADNRSPATVGGKRGAQDAALLNGQPKFHRVTARAGDTRIGVGAFQRAEIARELSHSDFVKVAGISFHS